MKVFCQKHELQRALAQVSRAVATKGALPVLGNVLLSAEQGRLKIAATDLTIGVTTWLPAEIEAEGRLTVDARLLVEFVGTLPNDPVEMTVNDAGTALTVRCGRSVATINGIDADDFPVLPAIGDDAVTIEITTATLREMIAQVEFAAASDDSRPVLSGVLMRVEGETITLATADGFRLAVRDGRLSTAGPERFDAIVPAKAMRELARIAGDRNEVVHLSITPTRSQLLARVGETEFLSTLIDGAFPDYRQIVPRDFTLRVEVDRDQLMSGVRRASYFARENNDVIRLTIGPGYDGAMGAIEVTGTAAERGTSQSVIDASVTGGGVTGGLMQIAFNAKFLTDVLGALRFPRLEMRLNGPNQAGVLRTVGDVGAAYVIMPMVIGDK